MNRTALIAALAVVAVSPTVASAASPKPKPKPRTITFSYSATYNVTTPVSVTSECTRVPNACFDIQKRKGERIVKITTNDSRGKPIGIQIYTDGDESGEQDFCGTAQVKVPDDVKTINVRQAYNPACSGQPTSGTLTAVLSGK